MNTHITDIPEIPEIRRLQRSRSDRMVAGVSGGLARYFEIHPAVFRVGFVVLTLLGGAGILIYAAAALVMPDEGKDDSIATAALRNRRDRPWPLIGARPRRRVRRRPAVPGHAVARGRRVGALPDRRCGDPLDHAPRPSTRSATGDGDDLRRDRTRGARFPRRATLLRLGRDRVRNPRCARDPRRGRSRRDLRRRHRSRRRRPHVRRHDGRAIWTATTSSGSDR